MAGVAGRIAFQVVLMLRLGLPEIPFGLHLCDDLARPAAGAVDRSDHLLGDLLLRLVDIVDPRAIAGAEVVALAVQRRRVVDLEEELDQLPVTDPGGVEDDLDALGMAAVIAIGRILHIAAGVADTGLLDAGELADQVLHAPEAAACEYSTFRHVKPPCCRRDKHRHPNSPWRSSCRRLGFPMAALIA